MASGWSKITGSSRDIKSALYMPGTVGAIVSSTFWDEPEASQQNGSFASLTVTDQPVVAAGSLAGQQNGTITAAAVSAQPIVDAAEINGLQAGNLSLLPVTTQPAINAATITGVQAGTIQTQTVSAQPVVFPGDITGVQNGAAAAVAVSVQPAIVAGALSGESIGSFTGLSASCQPDVEPVTVSAIRNGSIPAVVVSAQPAVTVGTITGQQQGVISGIGATCQPVITAGSLSGKQQGAFAGTTAATQPIVAPVDLSVSEPMQNGLFDALMISNQPVLAVPTISGQQNGLFASTQLQILIGSLSLGSLLTLADQLEDEVALLTPTQLQDLVRGALTAQGYTTTRAPKIDEIHGRLGLDPSAPLVTGQTSITFGDIVMAMTGDASSTTVTRQ